MIPAKPLRHQKCPQCNFNAPVVRSALGEVFDEHNMPYATVTTRCTMSLQPVNAALLAVRYLTCPGCGYNCPIVRNAAGAEEYAQHNIGGAEQGDHCIVSGNGAPAQLLPSIFDNSGKDFASQCPTCGASVKARKYDNGEIWLLSHLAKNAEATNCTRSNTRFVELEDAQRPLVTGALPELDRVLTVLAVRSVVLIGERHDIEATIVAISIRDYGITYQVVWWNEGGFHSEWLEDFLVKPKEGARTQKVGFK